MSDLKLNILIVDDHPLMVEGYKNIFIYNQLPFIVNILTATNCEEAFEIITTIKSKIDVVFLDRNLPPYKEINSGEDLAFIFKEYFPESKIIILTSHVEGILLYNIIKKLNPSGMLVKSDFTAKDLLIALKIILDGGYYYSLTVKRCLNEITSKQTLLDNYNRQIISLLSQGIKTKNLPDYLPLSMSAIDKRKAQIKDYFIIAKGNDEDIIREARRLGLI